MKRFIKKAIALVLAGAFTILLAACGKPASSAASSAASSNSASAQGSEPAPQITPDAYPIVDGSTACIPLMAALLQASTGMDLTEAQSSITVSTTAYAWQNIGTYEDSYVDLLIVYEAPDYVQQMIDEAGIKLEITPIGRDALVFMTNDANPVNNLSQQQLIDIYGGKITNWKDVGGADSEIVPFQRSEDSGSQALFRKLLMQSNPLMDAPTELCPAEMGGLIDGVAAYDNSANALGYSVYYYVDQMYSNPSLKLLSVDGVAPGYETIQTESYPLCNQFYAVIRADAAPDSPERQLYNWLCSDSGASLIQAAGYVPVNG